MPRICFETKRVPCSPISWTSQTEVASSILRVTDIVGATSVIAALNDYVGKTQWFSILCTPDSDATKDMFHPGKRYLSPMSMKFKDNNKTLLEARLPQSN
jgi:hypothetical protein